MCIICFVQLVDWAQDKRLHVIKWTFGLNTLEPNLYLAKEPL
jgi:hypothetical protein